MKKREKMAEAMTPTLDKFISDVDKGILRHPMEDRFKGSLSKNGLKFYVMPKRPDLAMDERVVHVPLTGSRKFASFIIKTVNE